MLLCQSYSCRYRRINLVNVWCGTIFVATFEMCEDYGYVNSDEEEQDVCIRHLLQAKLSALLHKLFCLLGASTFETGSNECQYVNFLEYE